MDPVVKSDTLRELGDLKYGNCSELMRSAGFLALLRAVAK
jgi:hypothetical protein